MCLPREPTTSGDSRQSRAYTNARYRILLPDGVCERRIGVAAPHADLRLRDAGCVRHWQLLTACNPQSRRLRDDENAIRQRTLCAQLDARGWRHLDTLADDGDGGWPEAGFCVFDADPAAVLALARESDQAAIVMAALGEAPRLIWIAVD